MSAQPGGAAAGVLGPGQVIAGKYRIERLLGRGGMGVVFLARHMTLGKRVAIKLLRQQFVGASRHLLRFEREARTCGALEHENVAAIHDMGMVSDGRPYIVMEYIEGEALRDLLQREQRLSVGRAVGLIQQACRGLAQVHAAGVMHRDIKPENLMLTKRADGSDWLKIVDFGIARLLHGEEVTVTQGNARLGTPHYMAPETAEDVALDGRADVYALGVILFEMLTGKKPHTGRSYNAIMYQAAHHEVVSVRSLRPEVPRGLERTVASALHRDRAKRIASCQALLAALEPYAKDLGRPPTLDQSGSRLVEHVVELPSKSTLSEPRAHGPSSALYMTLAVAALSVSAGYWLKASGRLDTSVPQAAENTLLGTPQRSTPEPATPEPATPQLADTSKRTVGFPVNSAPPLAGGAWPSSRAETTAEAAVDSAKRRQTEVSQRLGPGSQSRATHPEQNRAKSAVVAGPAPRRPSVLSLPGVERGAPAPLATTGAAALGLDPTNPYD